MMITPKRHAILPHRVPPALAPRIFADLIGKPFEKGARGPDKFDCVGLAMEVAKRLGKQLPAYVSTEDELHAQLGTGGAVLADCPRVSEPHAGCAVLMRMKPNVHHLGVMVDQYRLLHAYITTGVIVERINSPIWNRRILGFYSLEAAK
jgi:cell wall-associated NlpC family hydrolase